ncbi:MAG: chromosomal replication initiator protein DnaA [Pseudomonadota bacterium]
MIVATWQKCAHSLKTELPPQQFNTWIRPIRVLGGANTLHLLTPNRFVLEWVREHFLSRIEELLNELSAGSPPNVILEVADGTKLPGSPVLIAEPFISSAAPALPVSPENTHNDVKQPENFPAASLPVLGNTNRKLSFKGELNKNYTFANFIQGKSNQLARAAAAQVASNPGGAYNPLFIYGGVGLGKTHLMHAIGNHLREKNPAANVVYLHSQTFVGSMVSALQLNAINEFKRYYHSVDALLIDDIQFFANKERSQEEFFHTFNAIFEGGRQIIMTCDKYHSEINGLEERLKSRFGWGLSVAVEPPELETRAAILINKANLENVYLANEEAMFMAQKLRSNVRELEGALKKVIAHARFLGTEISISLIKDALKDLLAIQNKLISVDNIQRTVAEYYKIKMADMISKRRNRSVARPRQIAMCLSKELTNHSLPEIGTLYGGRDHTTVLHACRTINDLRKSSTDIDEDYQNLLRSLSS